MTRLRLRHMAGAAALALGSLQLGGCAMRGGGSLAQIHGAPAAPSWPNRYAEQAAISLRDGSEGVELVEHRLAGRARVYELRPVGDRQDARAVLGAPGVVFSFRMTNPAYDATRHGERHGRPSRTFVVSTTDMEVRSPQADAPDRTTVVDLQALFMACRLRPVFVVGRSQDECRGVCVVAPGINDWTGIERYFMELAGKGWTVVVLAPDLMRTTRTSHRGRLDLHQLLPFSLVDRIDSELAEDAFTTEAVLRALIVEAPALAERPLVLVGASMGAIGLSATAARLETIRAAEGPVVPRVSGALFAGGGAGVGNLLLNSPLGRDFLRLAGVDLPSTDAAALRATLDVECTLAPERCLWALDGRPVLLIDARFDAIVPRFTADRLWRELGEPMRWSYPVGHIGLFALIGRAEWQSAAAWVDALGR